LLIGEYAPLTDWHVQKRVELPGGLRVVRRAGILLLEATP
jgi:hypothetical protein